MILNSRGTMDNDRFRLDMGGVEEAYQDVWRRIKGMGKK